MRRVPLVIFGAGKVGCALVRQLAEAAPLHASRDGLDFAVVAWCDSTGAAMDEDGLSAAALQAIESTKSSGEPIADTPYGSRQADLRAIVDIAGTDGCIVADVTASYATVGALELALQRGYSAATANKVPLSLDQATFERLTSRGRTRYESTVASAVPVIETAHAIARAADRVHVIRGALSGTLGFLCTGLEAGLPFSGLVVEAMRRGYTEPDPRIDLGGTDVARKALILARTLGWRLELGDVALEPMVPCDKHIPLSDFVAGLPALDQDLGNRSRRAAEAGQALRYIAELRDGKARVGLQTVPADTALGRLRGTDNLVAFHTRYYPDEPLVLQGRGAGIDAAAAGVHSDLVALASGRASSW